jgi:formylglycine-generating enzyme required for sulfatase activity
MGEVEAETLQPPPQAVSANMVFVPGGTFRMGSDKHYPE